MAAYWIYPDTDRKSARDVRTDARPLEPVVVTAGASLPIVLKTYV